MELFNRKCGKLSQHAKRWCPIEQNLTSQCDEAVLNYMKKKLTNKCTYYVIEFCNVTNC